MKRVYLFVAALLIPQSAFADPALKAGFAGALRGCEEWVLNPASWAKGFLPFIASTGLGNQIGPVDYVDPLNLPPANLRAGNHFWRINSTSGAGYVLVTSDRLPMCHITGGGNADLQPVVEAVLKEPDFAKRWELVGSLPAKDMTSTKFRNRADPAFSMVVSRAKQAGARTDRVQVIATATYALSK